MYVTINGFESDIIDGVVVGGGEQCENCGSWREATPNEVPDATDDNGVGWVQTDYIVRGSTVACAACGKTYPNNSHRKLED